MPKTKEEIQAWLQDKERKAGDKLVIEEGKPTNTPVVVTLEKVVTKL